MTMWRGLIGTPGYAAGTSGTVTVPAGATVYLIVAHASSGAATVTIFGGAAIPIINGAAPLELQFLHDLYTANTNSAAIAFVNTDSYAVFYVKTGNT
jgi:hypothetical protein